MGYADTKSACALTNIMWYDKRPQDTANGKSVMDIIYNSGKITRKFNSGKTGVLQKGMTGKELIDKYGRHTTN